MTTVTNPRTSTADLDAEAKALDRAHVFHSWSAQAALDPLVLAGGLGSHVWDHAGRRYLDFSSQLVNVNIGHQHPAVVAAIQRQAGLLATVAPSTAKATRPATLRPTSAKRALRPITSAPAYATYST